MLVKLFVKLYKKCCFPSSTQSWFLLLQAKMGLYEGETSLYFMIVQGDKDAVQWFLSQQAGLENRFVVLADLMFCI